LELQKIKLKTKISTKKLNIYNLYPKKDRSSISKVFKMIPVIMINKWFNRSKFCKTVQYGKY